MRRDRWNSFCREGYSFDAAMNQRSAGGIHVHEVKRTPGGWVQRIRQSNGTATAYSGAWQLDAQDGEAKFEMAKAYHGEA